MCKSLVCLFITISLVFYYTLCFTRSYVLCLWFCCFYPDCVFYFILFCKALCNCVLKSAIRIKLIIIIKITENQEKHMSSFYTTYVTTKSQFTGTTGPMGVLLILLSTVLGDIATKPEDISLSSPLQFHQGLLSWFRYFV